MQIDGTFGNILKCPQCRGVTATEAYPGNWRCRECAWSGMLYRERVSVDGWGEEYPGERVDRAWAVLAQYAQRTRLNLAADGPQTVMGDFLADLLHVAAAERLDFNAVLATARRHFEAEHDA